MVKYHTLDVWVTGRFSLSLLNLMYVKSVNVPNTSDKELRGPRAGLDAAEHRNIFVSTGNRMPIVHSQVCSLVTTVTKLS
jgi:hypothetical protein